MSGRDAQMHAAPDLTPPVDPVVRRAGSGATIASASLASAPADWWFETAEWRRRGRLAGEGGGRGSVAFVEAPVVGAGARWVVRPYRRGGLVRHLLRSHYPFFGAERTRVFREFRLLDALHRCGFPVPRPVAGVYRRRGPWYAAVLITEELAGFLPLSRRLAESPAPAAPLWAQIGETLRRFHDAGVRHADLNAHNVLVDDAGRCRVIDFDRGRFDPRAPLSVREREQVLGRLERSLRKLGHLPDGAARDGWTVCLEHAAAGPP
jgi:3-deoxy-D-manno-octulosonic acid kinase